jgi:hypothetical protein
MSDDKDDLGTGNWTGFGNAGHGLKIDWSEATRKHEAFKAAEEVRHEERLAEKRQMRLFKRGEDFIGPPDPRRGRPPMTR